MVATELGNIKEVISQGVILLGYMGAVANFTTIIMVHKFFVVVSFCAALIPFLLEFILY